VRNKLTALIEYSAKFIPIFGRLSKFISEYYRCYYIYMSFKHDHLSRGLFRHRGSPFAVEADWQQNALIVQLTDSSLLARSCSVKALVPMGVQSGCPDRHSRTFKALSDAIENATTSKLAPLPRQWVRSVTHCRQSAFSGLTVESQRAPFHWKVWAFLARRVRRMRRTVMS
jgi:hypothetical protein